MRCFKLQPVAYETTRLELDALRQMPAGETTYAPAAAAPKHADGDCLIAVRALHLVGPALTAVEALLAAGTAVEISPEDYAAWCATTTMP